MWNALVVATLRRYSGYFFEKTKKNSAWEK